MAEQETQTAADAPEPEEQAGGRLLLAFGIGTLVGIGLALTWIPERRRRIGFGRGYRRLREAGSAALQEIQKGGREAVRDFREELGASLEAAREEFRDIARQQLEEARKVMRREQRKRRR